jgi:hypothetical protein
MLKAVLAFLIIKHHNTHIWRISTNFDQLNSAESFFAHKSICASLNTLYLGKVTASQWKIPGELLLSAILQSSSQRPILVSDCPTVLYLCLSPMPCMEVLLLQRAHRPLEQSSGSSNRCRRLTGNRTAWLSTSPALESLSNQPALDDHAFID